MKIKKYLVLLLAILVSLFALCGCSSEKERVQEALDNLKSQDAFHITANMTASIDAGSLGSMAMKVHFEVKSTDEGSWISLRMSADEQNINMQQYIVGDRVYVYYPEATSQYIDCTSAYQQIADEGIGTSMVAFDFDVSSTRIGYSDTTINYNGNETNVLMVLVMLDNEQLTDMIRDLLVQQRVSYNALSGEDLEEAEDVYKDIEMESAEYAFFIDDNNNIIRFYVSAVLSLDILGQTGKYDIQMQYDILDTGDTVAFDMPDIQPENVITYEAFLERMNG